MPDFIINYHTGIVEVVEGTLDSVKELIFEELTLTCKDITIHNNRGEILTTTKWCEHINEENEANILIRIGNGFYQIWSDESENSNKNY